MNIFNQGFVAVKMTQYLVQYILVYHVLSWSILGYLGLSRFISGYLRVSWDISGYLWLSLAILGYLRPSWAVYVKYQVSGCQRMQERENYCKPPKKNKQKKHEDYMTKGSSSITWKKRFWLRALTVTSQLSLNRICYQLFQPEIEFDIMEKCLWHCACTQTTSLGKDD